MATTKAKKSDQLAKLEAYMQAAEGIAFARFDAVTVAEVESFRRALREQDMTYTVIKKTLIALAAKNTGQAEFTAGDLAGAVAVITSPHDSIAPAAAIKQMKADLMDKATKESRVNYAGALFEGEFLDEARTAQLADTPTREESLAKIVGMLQSGPQKLHGVLRSGLQSMHAIMDQSDKFATAA